MNRVWIELDRPADNQQGHERAMLASNMLYRLGVPRSEHFAPVWWSEKEQRYAFTIDNAGGFVTADDNGHWFSLDHFGRAEPMTGTLDQVLGPDENIGSAPAA